MRHLHIFISSANDTVREDSTDLYICICISDLYVLETGEYVEYGRPFRL